MFPDAASIADQYERDHDSEYGCPRCGRPKAATRPYCGRCTREKTNELARWWLADSSPIEHPAEDEEIPFELRSMR